MGKPKIFYGMSEEAIRQRVVAEAQMLHGIKEGTIEHKWIVDGYNKGLPKLPRGYRLRYDDAWCAAFVSYIGIRLGITDVILPEVGCAPMIELYRKAGRWMERDDYVPSPGDLVMYDWDAKSGPCTGAPDHVGMVMSVEGKTIHVIEGNYNNQVKYRDICVEYVKVRGYCLPDYASLEHGYRDVPEDAWYHKAVVWAAQKGITVGIGGDCFGADLPCTRAQAVTMLWRSRGKPKAKGGCPFDDVPDSAWYAEAVAWAAEKGITKGISEGTFAPDAPCTRAQIVTMLWRMKGRPMAENGDHAFTDVPGDAWYSDAVEWAWCCGITIGCSGRMFMPEGVCNRAQMVEMLYRMR